MTKNRKHDTLVYMRCRSCGRTFEGNSDNALAEWSMHLACCEKKHKK